MLIDEWYGFHPNTTWSTTTPANTDRLLTDAGFDGSIYGIGITRAYATRHSAGPFATEEACLTTTIDGLSQSASPVAGRLSRRLA